MRRRSQEEEEVEAKEEEGKGRGRGRTAVAKSRRNDPGKTDGRLPFCRRQACRHTPLISGCICSRVWS